MKRAIIIVLDSLGIGYLPDAAEYGDVGANTIKSIALAKQDFAIPNLIRMGFGNIEGITVLEKSVHPTAAYGRLKERSGGKDTITGHWEIAGLHTKTPFKTFKTFPDTFIKAYEKAIGSGILGNYAASGTEIIKALGPLHKKTGKPIVYTSADSVFQIAVNIDVIPLKRLYEICETAREMLVGDMQVGRVIARPFVVESDGTYIRTSDRKDYSVSPGEDTLLDQVKKSGKVVYAIGKISDIFNGKGITDAEHTVSNQDGVEKTISAIKKNFGGLIFTNLVEFDSIYGHRRDSMGYAICLEEFDARLPDILSAMKDEDILLLCADHGNDPGYKGWDHTREYVPLLIFGKSIKAGVNLGTGDTFADIAATVAEYLEVGNTSTGTSHLFKLL
jgi:phosphopentomutase